MQCLHYEAHNRVSTLLPAILRRILQSVLTLLFLEQRIDAGAQNVRGLFIA
jgi:hypothetical protein